MEDENKIEIQSQIKPGKRGVVGFLVMGEGIRPTSDTWRYKTFGNLEIQELTGITESHKI